MKNLSRPEYSTGEFRLIGAILKMHRFETYRRTERISYPPFTSHFSFQSITGIDLYSRFGGEDLHLTPACWIIHPSSRPCIISFRIQFPSMARYVEYKNKTQEKCNYCTIYQCISGFYKKNVELHLLLILAIDSVIYSFYVTILLCKNACFSIKILIFVVEEKISNSSIWLVPRK